MKRTARYLLTCGSTFLIGLMPFQANAEGDLGNGWGGSALEISQLPNYCQQQFLSKNDKNVYQRLSPGCDGVHHLCAGLMLLTRVTNSSIPKGERKRILGQADKEIGYAARRFTPSCIRLPDVREAEARARMYRSLLN